MEEEEEGEGIWEGNGEGGDEEEGDGMLKHLQEGTLWQHCHDNTVYIYTCRRLPGVREYHVRREEVGRRRKRRTTYVPTTTSHECLRIQVT